MGFLILLSLLLTLGVVLGIVFGWLAWFKVQSLEQRVKDLQQQVLKLQSKVLSQAVVPPTTPIAASSPTTVVPAITPEAAVAARKAAEAANAVSDSSRSATFKQVPRPAATPPRPAPTDTLLPKLLSHATENWMVWLGGICVSLAGIFLVRYSIQQGLIAPAVRIALGVVMGLALHVAAEWLRRRRPHAALAALAGGGSLTLFAAILSGLHLYGLLNPTVSFVLLALIALITMWQSLLHGPVLAALGLLGAYLVPAFVGGDGSGANIALTYVLIISGAGLLLLQYVERSWLRYGVLAGAALWWLLTLSNDVVTATRALYLTVFAWLWLAIPTRDWFLQNDARPQEFRWQQLRAAPATNEERANVHGIGLLVLLWFFSLLQEPFASTLYYTYLPFVALLLWVAGKQSVYLALVPVLWLLELVVCLLPVIIKSDYALAAAEFESYYWFAFVSTLLWIVMSLLNMRRGLWPFWLPLTLFAAPAFLVTAYIVSAAPSGVLNWPSLAALLGGIYWAIVATRGKQGYPPLAQAWLYSAAHVAYAIAVAMYFRDASLTLALAVQMISLAWLIRRYELPLLGWLLKIVVACVIGRLTLNPWLATYATDIHWSLWSCGGATVCSWLASRLLTSYPELRSWTLGAMLHLFALTVWSELRWWLYDGNVMAHEFTALEAGLNCGMFGSLALVYYLREKSSERLAWLYRRYSLLLMVLSAGNYLVLLLALLNSSPWLYLHVAPEFLLNSLWLYFGLPVVLAALTARYYLPQWHKPMQAVTAAMAFIFVTLQIRHFWQSSVNLQLQYTDAELYTYSAIWLLLAVAAILGGVWRTSR
ncbi:MAG: DUF2339 domain-containing protein, partial [Pseudomonadota bacterium]